MHISSQFLTREQMREYDRKAIEEKGIPGMLLMENAGRSCAEKCVELAGGNADFSVAVFAGGGNNGGDGFVAARHLHLKGAEVCVVLTADESKISGDAAENLKIIKKMGLQIIHTLDSENLRSIIAARDIIIDALLGTGFSGSLREPVRSIISLINESGKKVLAVDIPSGMDCNTADVEDIAVKAEATVTFAARKKGFAADNAAEYTGRITVAGIGG
ncbi:Nicotinamide nucleotide repair protein [Sedimentisphaera cyanobacteriorum]|uniref:NAD(P)H-hydrate epimerase n=1 Tax=Sedimentisphaera cyanobacteriorum TaxID=1940790 RepID=A0A1Q2HNM0_9BACT|nr:NAD(P)H-hydrate epimerase [Sedimentisphaera cyanobacteriorum]AQQ08854.1 Nicotinamide nucleotide repair protein [Sedimentisphaera cyanobacteriorum]